MAKIIVIDLCNYCVFFDDQYPDYAGFCMQLDKAIPQDKDFKNKIPDDCPLTDTDDEVTV